MWRDERRLRVSVAADVFVDARAPAVWSSLCFVGLALNNLLLSFDLVITPALDSSALRGFLALAAMMILLFGLVWEQR